MTRLFLTLIFCLGSAAGAAAAAEATPAPQRVAAAQAKPDIVQAALVIPGTAPMRAPTPQAAAQAPAAPMDATAEDDGEHHGTAMLLAALALMMGIALRRWGTADR